MHFTDGWCFIMLFLAALLQRYDVIIFMNNATFA